jgi:AraC-like DNA-binding protein
VVGGQSAGDLGREAAGAEGKVGAGYAGGYSVFRFIRVAVLAFGWGTRPSGAPAQRIARAIRWLKDHFADPLRVEALARRAGMSPSAFHLHFKGVTALSPLQYQKRLRLQEARRLMLGEGFDAAEAAFRVGYEGPSQFSREYRRLFGAPPRRDVAALKMEAGATA